MGRGQSNWCQNSCCLKISAIVSEIYFIKASEGGTIIFQSSNRLENSAGYREWSSILSDRKLSPILYGGIFQNYHDWTQTANSNANIICNMLFLNHPLSTGLRTQLGKQAWKAEQHIVNRPTNASFWNIHFKVFFVLVFFQDFRLCVAVRCSNKWDSNEAGLSSRTSLQTTCHLEEPFPNQQKYKFNHTLGHIKYQYNHTYLKASATNTIYMELEYTQDSTSLLFY